MIRLPIDAHLPEILSALEKSPNLVLQAAPGTGKTTRVPPALLQTAWRGDGEIWVLEPRRLAAKLAARRVAEERGEKVGETIGYQFRFENAVSARTRVRFLTEGMLLRHLLTDPDLRRVSAVVLDEFHERHLQGDLAIALVRQLQKRRPDLRLIVMSATLRMDRLKTFLGDPRILDIAAPHFPLELRYQPAEPRELDRAVARTVTQILREGPDGDILVFLPGMAEIRRTENALAPIAREAKLAIHSLHGDLSREEQEAAVLPGPRRKVVLSTNIAESSLTIVGVSIVVDSGLHRQASASSWSGLPALRTRPISRASATQRAGRAARTGPGLCIRLYSQGDFDTRPAEDTAEILRADLCQTLLELKAYGIRNEQDFEWFEAPAASALQRSAATLHRLGALDSAGVAAELTGVGKKMARFPAHPRVARLLLEAERHGCTREAIALAAILSESELEQLDVMQALRRQSIPPRSQKRFEALLTEMRIPLSSHPPGLPRAVLAAYADRVARRKKNSRHELLLSSGGTLWAEDLGVFHDAQFFAVVDAREQQLAGQPRARLRAEALVPLEEEWLVEVEPSPLVEETHCLWDATRERVGGVKRLRYDELVVEEDEVRDLDAEQVREMLLSEALGASRAKRGSFTHYEWMERLSKVAPKEMLESVLARQQLARDAGRTELPSLETLVLEAMMGCSSVEDLRQVDWESALLPTAKFGRFPSNIQLPGGRQVKVQYAMGRAPWIESRLQDFFGMKQGPALFDGKLPLTLHLLAPNYRAVQVTTDLAGFWKNTYPSLRRELSRNYPKHSWPEDPLNAQPPPPRRR